MVLWLFFAFFFFKQKTAYVMRIRDWSSDVCSSDLRGPGGTPRPHCGRSPLVRAGLGAVYRCAVGPGRARWPDDGVSPCNRVVVAAGPHGPRGYGADRKSTRLNSSH